MKKSLLATTAIAALGAAVVAAPAVAQEKIMIGVGGYMEQWFGYHDNKDSVQPDRDGFDQQSDGEIHFKGETTLDNGLRFGVNVQLEAEQDNDQIDEQYAYVAGSFGRFVIGNENAAPYLMNSGLGGFGAGTDSGDLQNWIAGMDFGRAATVGNFARENNDSHKITYFSPRFSGFQIGVSYTPEQTQDAGGPTNERNAVLDDGFAVGANFVRSFNDFSVRLQGGYESYGDDDAIAGNVDTEGYGGGIHLGFGGFGVAGNYMMVADHNRAADNDLETYGFRVSYSGGPFGISALYIRGEEDNVGGGANDVEQDNFELGARYILGPGVEVRGSIYYGEAETNGVETAEGFAVVGGLKLGF